MIRSLPVSVHTYVLESHILSTKMGLDSKLNFIIRFTSDIGDSLLVLINREKDQKKIDKNLEIGGQGVAKKTSDTNYVNMMVELRCTLLYLIYQKYEVELLLCDECASEDFPDLNENQYNYHCCSFYCYCNCCYYYYCYY